jgi:hypothetical protein
MRHYKYNIKVIGFQHEIGKKTTHHTYIYNPSKHKLSTNHTSSRFTATINSKWETSNESTLVIFTVGEI